MTMSVDSHSVLGPASLGTSMSSVAISSSQRNGADRPHGRLGKHRRRPSNASAGSANSPAVTQFPVFDPTFEHSNMWTTTSPTDPLPLFKQSRMDSGNGHQHGSSFSKKIKPLVRYTSVKDNKLIDLNLSKAENEERGAYIADSSPLTSEAHSSAWAGGRAHSRTLSGASQISSSSAHSGHRSTTYVHPARQVPHSPTPPVPTVNAFEPPGVLRPESSHSSLANIPSLPPPNHYRTSNLSALRSQASTPTAPSTPALIPSAPVTARSSIDSTFRDRVHFSGTRRSRRPSRNKEPMDYEAQQLEILRQRQAFNERQDKKNEKYRAADQKKQREEERKARRKSEAAENARVKRNARRRGDSNGTVETVQTFDMETGIGEQARRTATNVSRPSATQRSSADQLSAIGYASTSELGRPKMGRRNTTDDGEEMIQEKIPKRQKTQGAGSAGKAVQSRWSYFWFQVKTNLMKFFGTKTRR